VNALGDETGVGQRSPASANRAHSDCFVRETRKALVKRAQGLIDALPAK
jgi:hypothetical protein